MQDTDKKDPPKLKIISDKVLEPVLLAADKHYLQFYKPEVCDKILALYVEGNSLYKIADMEGMPAYNTMLKWLKDRPEFKKQYDTARELRAIHFEEKALEAAERATCKDDTPSQRLKFDAYKWAAEVHDGARYGKKTTVQGDPNKPITFTVVTGVPASEHIKPVELDERGIVKQVEEEIVEAELVEPEQAAGVPEDVEEIY